VVSVVDDTAPVPNILILPTAIGECSVIVEAPTAIDNCSGILMGETTDLLSYNSQGNYSIIWTYNDGNGNTSSQTQNVIVKDITPPVIPVLPLVTGVCSASVNIPTTTDNCSGTVTGTTSDPLTYSTQGTHVIHWSFDDGNGNTTTATQTVTINDITPPVIACPINTILGANSGCNYVGSIGMASATDNCSGNVTITNNAPSAFPLGNTTVTWTAKDGANNVSTCTQLVTVVDYQQPNAVCKNISIALALDGKAIITSTDIDGGSSDNCGIASMVVSKTIFTCADLGTNTVTLSVTDNSGNSSICIATVTVTDPTPPVLSVADVNVRENEGKASLTVSLANARSCDVSFSATTADNTAIAPGDYSSVSPTVYTIPAGSTSVVINIPITNDNISESTESFYVNLSNPQNCTIPDNQSIVTIVDDDSPPIILIGDASATEGDVLKFPVTMNNVSSSEITVTLGFTHVTTSDNDFTTTPVVVIFPAGTVSATAVVPTTADPLQEADETFIIKISATTGLVGDASDTAVGTIIDDDSHPIAVDDEITTNEDVPFQGNVALNDATNATTGNVWSVAQTPDHGTVVMSTDGKFTYTPAANYNGNDAFSYKLCDAEGDCDEAVVSVTIVPVNDKPVANDDQINFYLDGILNGKVADNDLPSGDGGNIWTIISQPANGTISFNQDGSFIYTPNLNFLGSDSFTYRLCDVDGDCDQATVTIVIEDVVLPNQVLTPNGDEDNETFIINGIQFYPQNNLTVYNRWGNKVYQKSGYNNEWKGESNTSKVGSSALPVGTYFFVLEYGKQRHKTGYVYLDR
jgi:gliding motility-associated-like protein